MATDSDSHGVYTKLRRAVAADVRRARRDFCSLLLEPLDTIAPVLELASRPGEGRVRQMMATAVRVEPLTEEARREMGRWLRRWAEVESDEFARTAIVAALQTIESAEPPVPIVAPLPPDFVTAYRFAAERLCHRVRQALTVPTAMVVRLEQLADETSDAGVRATVGDILSRLRPALQRLSRTVEFDTEDGHVRWQDLALGEWLDVSAQSFSARFGTATLTLIGTDAAKRATIRAIPFLLETAFGNLWSNAVQAVENAGSRACHITVELNAVGGGLDVLVRDSGPGFPTQLVDTAFRFPFSTKSESRGRGLLEIADAVAKLQGVVKLVPVAANEHRVLIRLPLPPQ